MNKIIKAPSVLKCRAIGDYEIIFEIKVIERKKNFAKIIDTFKQEKRVKIYADSNGEYIQPEKYSMAPIFRAQ